MNKLNSRRGILLATGLALVALAVPSFAETVNMRIEIPFAFVAGNEVLPAGTYEVGVDRSYTFADFRSIDETRIHRVMLTTSRLERKPSESGVGTLQFQKYGDRLALRAVWNAWGTEGYVFQKSKAERELAKTVAPGAVETIQSFNK